jgi:hypothetical protein
MATPQIDELNPLPVGSRSFVPFLKKVAQYRDPFDVAKQAILSVSKPLMFHFLGFLLEQPPRITSFIKRSVPLVKTPI